MYSTKVVKIDETYFDLSLQIKARHVTDIITFGLKNFRTDSQNFGLTTFGKLNSIEQNKIMSSENKVLIFFLMHYY